MATGRVEFFFDFISPYSYLAWPRVRALCRRRGIGLELRPVLFAALLNHGGQRGPAEIPAKREWLVMDCLRIATLQGVRFTFPAHHPFNPVTALRVALPEVAGDRQEDVVEALWSAGWASGIDLGSADAIARALDGRGLDGGGLVARASEPAAKEALRRHTSDAIARGVFGLPTMLAARSAVLGQRPDRPPRAGARRSRSTRPCTGTRAARPLGVGRARRPAPGS